MKNIIILLLLINVCMFGQKLKFEGSIKQASLLKISGQGIDSAWHDNQPLKVNNNEYFILGFDRDDSSSSILKVKFNNGEIYRRQLIPAKRKYSIQRINNMKPSLVTHPESENERIIAERKISQEARSKVGENKIAMYANGFIRPVAGGRISGKFGNQRILNGEKKNFHNGVDIALPTGTPVYAMADGVVLLAADTFYYSGNNILIDHGDGLNSFYLHLQKKFVKAGDIVKAGDKIGEVGSTGRSTGAHLHWGVQWYDKRLDPLDLIKNFGKHQRVQKKKK
ncbi:MAG: M23 family metallopeptidase [Ignavibacteriales bacterium]